MFLVKPSPRLLVAPQADFFFFSAGIHDVASKTIFFRCFSFLSRGVSDSVDRLHHLQCFPVRHRIDHLALSNGPQSTRIPAGEERKKKNQTLPLVVIHTIRIRIL